MAYVENFRPRRWSNLSTARTSPDRALLDEVLVRHAPVAIVPGHRVDQAQVGDDHLLLGRAVAAFDAAREPDLLGRGQHAARVAVHLTPPTRAPASRPVATPLRESPQRG